VCAPSTVSAPQVNCSSGGLAPFVALPRGRLVQPSSFSTSGSTLPIGCFSTASSRICSFREVASVPLYCTGGLDPPDWLGLRSYRAVLPKLTVVGLKWKLTRLNGLRFSARKAFALGSSIAAA